MHWSTLWHAAAVFVAVATPLLAWRVVFRPARAAWREVLALLKQIRDASRGVQNLAREVEGLAGAVVRLVVSIVEDQRQLRVEHQELRERQSDQADLLLEVMGDVRDLQRPIEEDTNDHDRALREGGDGDRRGGDDMGGDVLPD